MWWGCSKRVGGEASATVKAKPREREEIAPYIGILWMASDQLRGNESRRNTCEAFPSGIVTSL